MYIRIANMQTDEKKIPCQNENKIVIKLKQRNKYIYIIQLAEYYKQKIPIYKIGRTHSILTRFSSYPKKSRLIYLCKVNDCHHVEDESIDLFKKNFDNKKDIGREYFAGSISITKMIEYTELLINTMNQRVNDDFKYIKDRYSNHLKITLYNENQIVDDDIKNLDILYPNEEIDDNKEDDDDKEDDIEEEDEVKEEDIKINGFVSKCCGKKFASRENLAYHVNNMVCAKEHKCKYCVATFTTKTSMYRHMRESCKVKQQRENEENKQNDINKKIQNLEKQIKELAVTINNK
jgi:hypothetical protein